MQLAITKEKLEEQEMESSNMSEAENVSILCRNKIMLNRSLKRRKEEGMEEDEHQTLFDHNNTYEKLGIPAPDCNLATP
ncbi:hypothetical protein E2C01_005625 [Portunus trituberculatus]|uniref:Uncharacterized protein n=1 Tax=Portunus trituberculatus TaxID=210409 RepID=A0A5B7CU12_PORTR|nr:hypothetical protein [Portunus trituberculatus]